VHRYTWRRRSKGWKSTRNIRYSCLCRVSVFKMPFSTMRFVVKTLTWAVWYACEPHPTELFQCLQHSRPTCRAQYDIPHFMRPRDLLLNCFWKLRCIHTTLISFTHEITHFTSVGSCPMFLCPTTNHSEKNSLFPFKFFSFFPNHLYSSGLSLYIVL
jgi:hypothetical protein